MKNNGSSKTKKSKLAQSTLEYTVIIGVVVTAIIVMQVYAKRGIQAATKAVADQLSNQEKGEVVDLEKGGYLEEANAFSNSIDKRRIITDDFHPAIGTDMQTTFDQNTDTYSSALYRQGAYDGDEESISSFLATACSSAGGEPLSDGRSSFCRFDLSSCPVGWSPYENWSTTRSVTCPESIVAVGCPDVTCTTGSHASGNIDPAGEMCIYYTYPDYYVISGYPPHCGAPLQSYCIGEITQIGCKKD